MFSSAPKTVFSPDDAASDASSIEELLARRRDERRLFLDVLRSPKIQPMIEADEAYFASLLELAIMDYGVSRRSLSHLSKASESSISRWMSRAVAPRPWARKPIVDLIADLLAADLFAEDRGVPRPKELDPYVPGKEKEPDRRRK